MYRVYEVTRDAIIEQPKKGHGASLTVRYLLPRAR